IVLDEMIRRHRAVFESESPESRARMEALEAARRKVERLVGSGSEKGGSERFRADLASARLDAERAERELAALGPASGAAAPGSRPGLGAVGAALPPSTALVAYVSYGRAAGPGRPGSPRSPRVRSYAAFVLRRGDESPLFVPLGSAASVESDI